MDRKIKLSELRSALQGAYDKYRAMDVEEMNGAVDPRVSGEDASEFGIAVTLTDGTVIALGDSGKAVPMTTIAKVPINLTLLTQYRPMEIIERMGMKKCAMSKPGECVKPAKPEVAVSPKGIRAMSMLQPVGDPDGKWDIYSSMLIGLMGSEPVLSDGFYEKLMGDNKAGDTVNALAEAAYYLYDDAAMSVKLYTKASAMTASAEQLSAMAATIAADGYNPLSKGNVFDGALAPRITGLMAAKGPHKMAKPWLMLTGLPAVSSYAGTMMGVLPGVMGIAAYSPAVNGVGISVRSALAISEVMNTLGLSALGSARVTIVDE
ncbi:MAG: glutaminase [Pseudoflavonifractor sp.]|nr:glutaminase [Alloprevotella sp.]MCM1116101.1 glutaminase [Pseudoflavonifractor sp.]